MMLAIELFLRNEHLGFQDHSLSIKAVKCNATLTLTDVTVALHHWQSLSHDRSVEAIRVCLHGPPGSRLSVGQCWSFSRKCEHHRLVRRADHFSIYMCMPAFSPVRFSV
jgi:hypothetical protein